MPTREWKQENLPNQKAKKCLNEKTCTQMLTEINNSKKFP